MNQIMAITADVLRQDGATHDHHAEYPLYELATDGQAEAELGAACC